MVTPFIENRVCVRKPESLEEWKELILKLEAGEIDDLPVTAAIRICKVIGISSERLFEIFDEDR